MADIIREGVEALLAERGVRDREEVRRRALAVVGAFRSGPNAATPTGGGKLPGGGKLRPQSGEAAARVTGETLTAELDTYQQVPAVSSQETPILRRKHLRGACVSSGSSVSPSRSLGLRAAPALRCSSFKTWFAWARFSSQVPCNRVSRSGMHATSNV